MFGIEMCAYLLELHHMQGNIALIGSDTDIASHINFRNGCVYGKQTSFREQYLRG